MLSLLYFVILIAVIVGMWKMFEKAGQPGWKSIIPFYNLWVLNEIGGKPWWFFVAYFIPFINIVCYCLLSLAIAKKFGQETLYGFAIFIFPFIFYPILGFGDARYRQ